MRAWMAVGGIAALLGLLATALRRGWLPEQVSVGGLVPVQSQMASRVDEIAGSMESSHHQLLDQLNQVKEELESMRRDMLSRVEQSRKQLEVVQRDVQSVEHDIDTMQHGIIAKIDEIRSQREEAEEKPKSHLRRTIRKPETKPAPERGTRAA